jgi:hypothetical protein
MTNDNYSYPQQVKHFPQTKFSLWNDRFKRPQLYSVEPDFGRAAFLELFP